MVLFCSGFSSCVHPKAALLPAAQARYPRSQPSVPMLPSCHRSAGFLQKSCAPHSVLSLYLVCRSLRFAFLISQTKRVVLCSGVSRGLVSSPRGWRDTLPPFSQPSCPPLIHRHGEAFFQPLQACQPVYTVEYRPRVFCSQAARSARWAARAS